jgi:hypothetical protein
VTRLSWSYFFLLLNEFRVHASSLRITSAIPPLLPSHHRIAHREYRLLSIYVSFVVYFMSFPVPHVV